MRDCRLEPWSLPKVCLFPTSIEEHAEGMQAICDPCFKEKGHGGSLENLLVVQEFVDVFLEELPGLPPERELEFTIDLKLGTEPIERMLYRMLTPELQELKMQLKELLDLVLILTSVTPCGALVIFIWKKDGSWRLYIDYR
jgi:hypothetical protein